MVVPNKPPPSSPRHTNLIYQTRHTVINTEPTHPLEASSSTPSPIVIQPVAAHVPEEAPVNLSATGAITALDNIPSAVNIKQEANPVTWTTHAVPVHDNVNYHHRHLPKHNQGNSDNVQHLSRRTATPDSAASSPGIRSDKGSNASSPGESPIASPLVAPSLQGRPFIRDYRLLVYDKSHVQPVSPKTRQPPTSSTSAGTVNDTNTIRSSSPFDEDSHELSEQELQQLRQAQMALQRDEDGDLPLHIAVAQEEVTMVDKLIQMMAMADVSVDVYNNLKQTPLHLAVIVERPDLIQMLLGAGASPDLLDRHGQTSVHAATAAGKLNCLKALVTYAKPLPDLNAKNYEGLTPMHIAVQQVNRDIVEYLLSLSALDIDCLDGKSGRTPLFHAAESNQSDLCKMMLNKGADPNIQNYSGNTAVHAASGRAYSSIVAMLVQYGAVTYSKDTLPTGGASVKMALKESIRTRQDTRPQVFRRNSTSRGRNAVSPLIRPPVFVPPNPTTIASPVTLPSPTITFPQSPLLTVSPMSIPRTSGSAPASPLGKSHVMFHKQSSSSPPSPQRMTRHASPSPSQMSKSVQGHVISPTTGHSFISLTTPSEVMVLGQPTVVTAPTFSRQPAESVQPVVTTDAPTEVTLPSNTFVTTNRSTSHVVLPAATSIDGDRKQIVVKTER